MSVSGRFANNSGQRSTNSQGRGEEWKSGPRKGDPAGTSGFVLPSKIRTWVAEDHAQLAVARRGTRRHLWSRLLGTMVVRDRSRSKFGWIVGHNAKTTSSSRNLHAQPALTPI
eukprot:760393-Rhodomonas_salina.1